MDGKVSIEVSHRVPERLNELCVAHFSGVEDPRRYWLVGRRWILVAHNRFHPARLVAFLNDLFFTRGVASTRFAIMLDVGGAIQSLRIPLVWQVHASGETSGNSSPLFGQGRTDR